MIEHDNGKIICNLRREDMLPVTSGDESLFLRFLEVPHPCSDLTCIGNVNRKKLELWYKMLTALKHANVAFCFLDENKGWTTSIEVRTVIAEAEEMAGE